MNIKKKLFQKIFSVFSSVLLLVNSFTPYLLVAPVLNSVSAQEEVSLTITPTIEPTTEPTSVPTPTTEPTVIPTITSTSVPSPWTFENVELNKEYISPQNSEVKLIFTKLPTPSGNIKIEEITLTKEQIEQTGSLSDKAYDITSDMIDGSFSYNLSLPIPESSKGKPIEVKFAEEISEIDSAEKVENTLIKTDTSVSVTNLDHMTIFILTDDNTVYSGTWVDYATQGYSEDGVHYPTTLPAGQTATWTFSSITPGSYNIYVSWSTHANRTTSAPYTLNHIGGVSPFIVNQEQLADQTTNGSSGQWSGWYKVGTFNLDSSSNLVLTSIDNTSGTDYVIADEILLAPNTAPAIVWINDDYSINSKNDGHVWDYDAFNNIQDGIAAVAGGGTINVAVGTYTEAGQIVIDKDLSIIGIDKNTTIIKPSTDTTGNNVNSAAWFLVNTGVTFNLNNVTLDGNAPTRTINWAIASYGHGTIDNNIIKNIKSGTYLGRGIVIFGDNTTVSNNIFNNIERIGVHVRGAYSGPAIGNATVTGNTYTCKGVGDFLDYGVEVGAGATATILNNTITNCHGVASSDNSTSAGILVTDYYGTGTTATITGNTISNSTVGVAVGYADGDLSTITQFNTNTFNLNDYDLDNHTANNIDARNNTWSVTDQNNLDQIETKINHYCSGSIYVHGTCSGTDDYSTGFGMVQYKNIGTPTNSGWNIKSQSATPNESPLDLDCPASTVYTNENNVAQNWTAVNGTNIKYQREVTFPSNVVSYFEAGSNTYTPFSTFGSGSGIEGLWKARVRAYVDANNNNTYNSEEEVSGWSNECQITFDKTNPTDPGTPVATVTSPTNQTTVTWNWTTSTDLLSGIKEYLWNLWKGVTKTLSGSTTNTYQTIDVSSYGDGDFSFDVQSKDNAGNVSEVMTSAVTTVDTVAPSIPTLNSPADGFATKGVAFTQKWNSVSGAVLYQYESCNVDPGDIGETCSSVKYTSTYTGTTKNVGVGQPDSHFWWRVRAKDTAGNWSGWSVSWELIIDNTAPVITIAPYSTDWTNSDITVNATTNEGSLNADSHTFSTNGSFDFVATDAAGNVTTETVTISNIDKESPSAPTVTKPVNNGYITSAVTQKFTWTSSTDPTPGSGLALTNTYQYQIDNDSDFSSTLRNASITGTSRTLVNPLPDGTYYVRVRAKDAVENYSSWSTSVMFTVDSTAPTTPEVTTPVVNGYINSPTTQTFEWTSSADPSPGSGLATTSTYQYQIDNNDDFSSTLRNASVTTTTRTLTNPLPEGSYYIRVRAKDAAGNYSSWSPSIYFTVDTTGPTASVTSPLADSYIRGLVTITADVADAVGIDKVEFWHATIGTKIGEGTETSPGTYSIDWDTTIVGDGLHDIWINAYDSAGNITSSDQISVTVDNTLPELTQAYTRDVDGNGYLDAVELFFSENINDDMLNSETADGWDVEGADGESIGTGDTPDDNILLLDFSEGPTPDGGNKPNVTYTASGGPTSTHDVAGNELASGSFTTSDGAVPVLLSAVTKDTDVNGQIDAIKLTFSENINDSMLNTSTNDNWDVENYDGEIIGTGSVDNDNILILSFNESGTLDTGVTPIVYYNSSFEKFSTHDTAGNQLKTGNWISSDGASPTTPTASPAAGDYTSDQLVTLESTDTGGSDPVTIYYTVDNSDPDKTKTLYSSQISVDHDMTIKAIAYDAAGNQSGVLTATYGIPPKISSEASTFVGTTSTTITWTTDDPSTSRVVYDTVSHTLGTAPNYGYAYSTVEDSAKVTSHAVGITGLTSGTTYYYRTISHGSPEAVGDEKSFKTDTPQGGGGTVAGASAPSCSDQKPGGAPVILSAVAGVNSVTITWSKASDPVSYYLMTFGTSPGAQTYGNPNIGGKDTTSYTVTGLSGGATYYFKVRAGNGCMPGDFSNEASSSPSGGFVEGIPAGFAPGVLGEATESAELTGEIPTPTTTVINVGQVKGLKTVLKNKVFVFGLPIAFILLLIAIFLNRKKKTF